MGKLSHEDYRDYRQHFNAWYELEGLETALKRTAELYAADNPGLGMTAEFLRNKGVGLLGEAICTKPLAEIQGYGTFSDWFVAEWLGPVADD